MIGTERHESRRIDNQLRGRSGRQGDPGTSIFFISLQDELMRLFGGDQIDGVLKKLDSRNEFVKAMAVWALFCLSKSRFLWEKKKRLDSEDFYYVRQEWLNGECN